MKKIILLLIGAISFFCANAQTDSAKYAELAAQIKKQYAPDGRSIYFSADITSDTLFLESSSQEAIAAFVQQSKDLQKLQIKTMLLPDSRLKGMVYGVANLSVTNNRITPGNSSELVTQMLLGTPVQILKKARGYYVVRSPEGYLSYVDSRAVVPMDLNTFNMWKAADKIIFTADLGHAYSAASTDSQRVSDLVAGNILQVLQEENSFYKVTFPDKRIAFIQKSQATPYKKWLSKPKPTAENILSTAKTMMGVPYLWGGTSIKGVDCSGFTKTSYFLNGVVIPRDASQQALVGKAVDITESDKVSLDKCIKNLKAGDLLFFGYMRNGVPKVTHTAIYMSNGEYIQSSGLVQISSLDPKAANYDEGHGPGLLSARRMLTDIGKPGITKVEQHSWYTTN